MPDTPAGIALEGRHHRTVGGPRVLDDGHVLSEARGAKHLAHRSFLLKYREPAYLGGFMPDSYTDADQRTEKDECLGIIPGTFIICGEGEWGERHYCSDACMARDQPKPASKD